MIEGVKGRLHSRLVGVSRLRLSFGGVLRFLLRVLEHEHLEPRSK